uniref:Immunoglobulin subtype domain-containing protein n=1 Tax=Anolis carolinensis TaxID=28377 RepID=A0A803TNV8_ANOCA
MWAKCQERFGLGGSRQNSVRLHLKITLGWPCSKGCFAESDIPSLLLSTAFVLSICFFSTEAFMKETNITMEPPRPVEGGKVYLIPHDLSPVPVICRWFRGERNENNTIVIFYFYPHPYIWNASAFTGREIMKSNCSLEIVDLNYNDTANYTVLIEGPMGSRIGTVELVIEGRSLIYVCISHCTHIRQTFHII